MKVVLGDGGSIGGQLFERLEVKKKRICAINRIEREKREGEVKEEGVMIEGIN